MYNVLENKTENKLTLKKIGKISQHRENESKVENNKKKPKNHWYQLNIGDNITV